MQCSWQWDKVPLGSGEAGAALSYYALSPESSLTDTLFDGATASVTYCASAQAEGETVSVDVLGARAACQRCLTPVATDGIGPGAAISA